MNFLLEYGISKETIEKIKNNHEDSIIFYCLTQKDNIREVINYLTSIKVTTIDTLLINRLELFLLPVERVKEYFEHYNIDVLVELINEDINVLNNI